MKQLCILLITLCIAGCSSKQQSIQSDTPASAITSAVLRNSRSIQDFRLFGTRPTPDDKVAGVYTFTQVFNDTPSPTYITGYAVAEQVDGSKWRVIIKAENIESLPPKPGLPINWFIYQAGYTAVYGPVLLKEVKTVGVTFADGEVAQEAISGDYYLIFSSEGSDVCKIEALGENKEVLYSVRLSPYAEESNDCTSQGGQP